MYISSALLVTETHSPTPLEGTGTDVLRMPLIFLHTRPRDILFKVISPAHLYAAYCTTRRQTLRVITDKKIISRIIPFKSDQKRKLFNSSLPLTLVIKLSITTIIDLHLKLLVYKYSLKINIAVITNAYTVWQRDHHVIRPNTHHCVHVQPSLVKKMPTTKTITF